MSDGIKAWHEDSDDYVRLCRKYGEQVRDEIGGVRGWPWNAKHHMELQARERLEDKP